ncbi:WhiB family transcriptional regulator [Actinokineospora diospyrosa]|uniref:WhiB family transcriptional regulator, redox-sensing transcriptional regulator n=1 Tax=Actinokineospora diospyrosa TaxID=103728 RepID=A0ABT1IFH8_9PSEU|nr:WhiB family transcriptional regulator [Actinokineospora diospyrosa]MCP2271402.1 WhiB family transcriptional regulator, redox-sensing transcriptional regulator [Actinokineospora diospyrosa]
MRREIAKRVAADLDGVAALSGGQLVDVVRRDGTCGWLATTGQTPEWTGDDRADRELVVPICGACPVQRECLEWDLRVHGYASGGVWGPLAEDERRAVFPVWSQRRDDAAGGVGGAL